MTTTTTAWERRSGKYWGEHEISLRERKIVHIRRERLAGES